jgi:hypothetical protein
MLDDVDVTMKNTAFIMHEWGTEGKNPYLYSTLEHAGGDEEVYWSCGGRAKFEAAPEGNKLVAKSASVKLSPKSNAGIFFASLLNSGYPEDKMEPSDIAGTLNGLECHIQRVPQEGEFAKGKREDGSEFTRTIVTVTKIHKLPWEKQKATKKTKKSKEPSSELETEVEGFVVSALADNPEGVPKKNLTKPVFNKFDGDDRNPALALVFDDEWLGADARPWIYEDGIIKIA